MEKTPDSACEERCEPADNLKLDLAKVLAILKPGGVLAQHFNRFQPRVEQQSMMRSVVQAYESGALALIEAGTGIGKSMAYLIPAMLWAATTGERTVISTHTIPLQEQLISKDVPLLLKALGLEMQVSLVKGMNNYICLRKWGDAMDTLPLLPKQEADELLKIEPWVDQLYVEGKDGKTTSGALPILPSHSTWERISADRETCVGRSCSEYTRCPFVKDRQQAQKAQILIVNHHMLFSDLSMRSPDSPLEDGLLPGYARIILDEAHHVEEVARAHFALTLSQQEIFRLLSRMSGEKHGRLGLLRMRLTEWSVKKKGEFSPSIAVLQQTLQVDIPAQHHEVKTALTSFFLALDEYMRQRQQEDGETDTRGESRLRVLNSQLTWPMWTEQIFPAMKQAMEEINSFCATIEGLLKECRKLDDPTFDEKTQGVRYEIKEYLGRLTHISNGLSCMQKPFNEQEYVRWVYKMRFAHTQDVGLVEAPLDMVQVLRERLFKPMRTVVLCSATLTTDGHFAFLRGKLGLNKEHTGTRPILEERHLSPFAYGTQALFAIPSDLPEPTSPDFLQSAVEAIWQALEASRGNALVLFTSYKMLLAAYSALKQRCEARRFPLLRQGQSSRSALLEALRQDDHSILFATYSFWEGVDVVGEALRCVMIVKLPFPVPNDPLFQAQSERLFAQGKNPFMELSLPMAMMRFTQGFGRLIRNQRDRGCVLCFDTRLVTRQYGTRFLSMLPRCKQVIEPSNAVWEAMRTFYRQTHYLTVAS